MWNVNRVIFTIITGSLRKHDYGRCTTTGSETTGGPGVVCVKWIYQYSDGQNRMSRRNSHELNESKSQNITKQSKDTFNWTYPCLSWPVKVAFCWVLQLWVLSTKEELKAGFKTNGPSPCAFKRSAINSRIIDESAPNCHRLICR